MTDIIANICVLGVDVFFNRIEQGSVEGPRKQFAEDIRAWYEMTFN